jgi:hypothetical protein
MSSMGWTPSGVGETYGTLAIALITGRQTAATIASRFT